MKLYSNLIPLSVLWFAFQPCFAFALSSYDPFHLLAKMPPGSLYESERINSDEIRAVTDITGTVIQGDIQIPDGYRLVTNFYHAADAPGFYTALIPTDAVEREYLLTQPFTVSLPLGARVTLAHHMLRFKMSKPVLLVAKTPDLQDFQAGLFNTTKDRWLEKPIKLYEIIFSPEPAAPYGVNVTSIADGIFNNRVMAFRLMSLSGRSKGIGDEEAGKIKAIPLATSREFAKDALEKILLDSTRMEMSTMYHIFYKRCDTVCMDILSASRPGLNGLEKNALTYAIAPLLDLINRAQYLTRIFPPLTPLSLMTRMWTDRSMQIEELKDSPEFKRLHEENPPSFCAVRLTTRSERQ